MRKKPDEEMKNNLKIPNFSFHYIRNYSNFFNLYLIQPYKIIILKLSEEFLIKLKKKLKLKNILINF